MDFIKLIRTRRSIRSFTKQKVTDLDIQTILECGLQAPSSKNSNPWFFVLTRGKGKDQIASWIEDGAQKNKSTRVPMDPKTGKMAKGAFDSTAESVQTIREASVLVLFFNRAPMSGGYKNVLANPRGDRSLYVYAGEMIGIGAAVQNMLLSAHALGLGAVFMADSYPGRIAVKEALNTDAEMIGSIAIGYPSYSEKQRKIYTQLISSWDDALKNGIPSDNFTGGIV